MTPTRMMTAAAALMLVLGTGAVLAQPAGPQGPWREAPRAEAPAQAETAQTRQRLRAEAAPRAEQRMEQRQTQRRETVEPRARAEARQGPRQETRGTPRGLSEEARAERREAVFAAMDADGDSRVTREEFMDLRMGPQAGGPRAEARQAAKAERFDAMDADGTGAITLESFRDHANERMAAREGGRPDNRPMRPRR